MVIGVEGTPYRCVPVTRHNLGDLETFARAYGKFGYCSCMRWRLPSSGFREAGRDGRAAELAGLVRAGTPVGVLAYLGPEVVGWCSVAPRETHAAVLASRTIPRIAGDEVWLVACFFLVPRVRGTGLTRVLLDAACEYAARSGARVVEAYPWPGGASYRFMGTRELYLAAGFADVPVAKGCRPVVRRTVSW
jgi:GNAT superfamily N-acetyltransferase